MSRLIRGSYEMGIHSLTIFFSLHLPFKFFLYGTLRSIALGGPVVVGALGHGRKHGAVDQILDQILTLGGPTTLTPDGRMGDWESVGVRIASVA
jgi:hypothetical protein